MLRFGIEFEYLLIDTAGPHAGRVRDFSNLPFAEIAAITAERPGLDDPRLATGDLGIKRGYWYLEGDERFDAEGRFRTLEVKGVEIRTPPLAAIGDALDHLLATEAALAAQLDQHGLGLAVAAFNPQRTHYAFDPPLTEWERDLRARHPAYDGSHVSTLSYGPDLNLSFPGWDTARTLAAVRRLNHYAPYLVPFSFSSPFHAGQPWDGWSWRSHERAALRPAVKLFLGAGEFEAWQPRSALIHPVRIPAEAGRIEFKAFDALPGADLLEACGHLLAGVCLAEDLPGADEHTDVALYRRFARTGFADPALYRTTRHVLDRAGAALARHGLGAADALAPLHRLLDAGRTPAHDLLDAYRRGGPMYRPGGLGRAAGPDLPHRMQQGSETHAR
ncbi:glutamate-cysteine ligase family protein [Pseudothauera rhizosphaerae]|nr:glutamate-cysteine ligase family protein [Pseudothauera rhizosphaerae]